MTGVSQSGCAAFASPSWSARYDGGFIAMPLLLYQLSSLDGGFLLLSTVWICMCGVEVWYKWRTVCVWISPLPACSHTQFWLQPQRLNDTGPTWSCRADSKVCLSGRKPGALRLLELLGFRWWSQTKEKIHQVIGFDSFVIAIELPDRRESLYV